MRKTLLLLSFCSGLAMASDQGADIVFIDGQYLPVHLLSRDQEQRLNKPVCPCDNTPQAAQQPPLPESD